MSLKKRRFSLDSSVALEGVGLLSHRRGSKLSKRSSKSLEEARLEIQELSQSLSRRSPLRDQTIAEEHTDRHDGLISKRSFAKHNKTFHKLFQGIPEGENVTHTFTCALQKEVLYHGKLFVSENYVCFFSSVLLKDTKVVIPTSSVREVKKQKSALSIMSIQTTDGEKYSFVSMRNRDLCYRLLQSVCSQAQRESANSSPHASSVENEDDQDMSFSYSSLEESVDPDPSRNNSISLEKEFLSNGVPRGCSSTPQSSSTDGEEIAESWMRSITQRVSPLLSTTGLGNLNHLFYIYLLLMALLLLASGFIGLRILALEEQLNTLGALTEYSFPPYQEPSPVERN
ncbi:GRAM domain-containing protein 2B-like isoform X2 [Lampris incognitus]|uniref:GRAM domain-containing protein 2B-like isoform X2 n=1 Tax=Lampris incognitus TaxID=2546036 RepID=UPI0024B60E5D|nr:GRAM domain-containing protein 2B-like isoform X2 [Lampris incognitus]